MGIFASGAFPGHVLAPTFPEWFSVTRNSRSAKAPGLCSRPLSFLIPGNGLKKKKNGKIEFRSSSGEADGKGQKKKKPWIFPAFFSSFRVKKPAKKNKNNQISAQGFGFNWSFLLWEGKFEIKWDWGWGRRGFLGMWKSHELISASAHRNLG